MESVVKSTLFMPKATTGTPLRVPLPAISHFYMLGFKYKFSNVLTTSPREFSFFKKNALSSTYAESR